MTTTAADANFDMYDQDIYASPYSAYHRLREEAPLYHNEKYDFYALSRFDDVRSVLVNRDAFISGRGMVYNNINQDPPEGLFIASDPPKHTIHRALVSRVFTPRAVKSIEPQVRELCTEVVDSIIGLKRFDAMNDLAREIPIKVIGMLVGIPRKDHAALQQIFHRSLHEHTANSDSSFDGISETARFFSEYLDWRAEHPTDDVMTQLVNIEFEDETGTTRRLRRQELIAYLNLITSAGSDTTATAIGWAISLLAAHPDQRRELVENPSLIPNAVEEVLRYEPPSYHICRVTSKAVEFYDQKVPEGGIMVVLPGAANRDPRRFPEAEKFDIHRDPDQIMTFGFGPHLCLGAHIARLETRLTLEALFKRIPEWDVDLENATYTTGIDTRGWDSLPVEV